jgi:hypothetical protein
MKIIKGLCSYLIIVGIPVVGILGLLQLGKTLTAPASVAGLWSLTLVRDATDCESSPVNADVMHITQSGRFVLVALGNQPATLAGEIKELVISASGDSISTRRDPFKIHLDGMLDRATSPTTFNGNIVFSSCGKWQFSAIRQADSKPGGVHH